ncbi:MAG TPA: hypothetical protein VNF07_04405 [Acidimicrobiales bacterium]|nr:hypothetical protein [Acidimicrobiales bacterium]
MDSPRAPEDEGGGAPAARLRFAPEVVFGHRETARLRDALRKLLSDAPPAPLDRLLAEGGPEVLVLERAAALDCAAALLHAADGAALSGECVAAYALLGMESRLLEELVGEGAGGVR